MKTDYDIIIIGAGASGLMCACMCAKRHPEYRICLLDKNKRVGKKLLATGNGRCNLTNLNAEQKNYHGSFAFSTNHLFERYSPERVLSVFSELGLVCRNEDDGRVYPRSNQASSVLDVLRLCAERHGIDMICDCIVDSVSKTDGGFTVRCGKSYTCKRLVFACGGKAYPTLGGTDLGFKLIKDLGHTVTTLFPALCPVMVDSAVIKSLKGIRAECRVSVITGGKTIAIRDGEVQFTDNSLSGICIFDVARAVHDNPGAEISLDLLPEHSAQAVYGMLSAHSREFNADSCEQVMTGIFHSRVNMAILKSCGISPALPIDSLKETDISKIAEKIKNWRFTPIRSDNFASAQVTAGGVSGNEVDPVSFESKIHRGMYIIGEALDCDGDCGGYNLQFAFASACAAAEAL